MSKEHDDVQKTFDRVLAEMGAKNSVTRALINPRNPSAESLADAKAAIESVERLIRPQ